MCRLRNDIADVLRELLKIITGLHEHGRLGAATVQIKYLRSWQAVRSADQPKDRCQYALPDHHRCLVYVDLCVCVGGYACTNIFAGTTFFAFGRPPLSYRSPQCTGATRARRSGLVGSAPIWLTVPRGAHDADIVLLTACAGKSIDEIKQMDSEERSMHANKCDKDRGIKAADILALAQKMKCPAEENTKLKRLVWILGAFDVH